MKDFIHDAARFERIDREMLLSVQEANAAEQYRANRGEWPDVLSCRAWLVLHDRGHDPDER